MFQKASKTEAKKSKTEAKKTRIHKPCVTKQCCADGT
jgi:hypothetical protein